MINHNPKDNNKDQFPGYPHYPAKEDITNTKNNNGKIPFEEENNTSKELDNDIAPSEIDSENNVTKEDIQMLNGDEPIVELDDTDTDGDVLNEKTDLVLEVGADLDVPGSEDDDANEAI